MTLDLERALRRAADWHRDQRRRGSGVPYVAHLAAVALILQRHGWPEPVVIAGLLHDAVEDTAATLDDVRAEFGPAVAELVSSNSEVKLDAEGRKRPWADRKRDHLAAIARAPAEARAVVLADKLHNLLSIELDLAEGRPIWTTFHAERADVLHYYAAMIDACAVGDDPRLAPLADECRAALGRVAGAAVG